MQRTLILAAASVVSLWPAVLEEVDGPTFFFYEENVGQAEPEILYIARGGGVGTLLTANSLRLFQRSFRVETEVRFAAPGVTPAARPLEAWPGVMNRFTGPAANWLRDIPARRRVEFSDVYPGVDLIAGGLEHRPVLTYVVQPGAELAGAALETLSGKGEIREGDWLLSSGFGSGVFKKPIGYQLAGELRAPVEAEFALLSDSSVSFDVGPYDRTRPLYLDVVVETSEPLRPASTVIDDGGNVFFAGGVASSRVCAVTPGATAELCPDAYVAGFDAQGSPMFFTTLAGAAEDRLRSLLARADGSLLAIGESASEDFPVTANAYQASNAGPIGPRPRNLLAAYGDLVLLRFDSANGDLLYSTFYGGPRGESSSDAAIDPDGDLTALIYTEGEFPTTAGAWFPSSPAVGPPSTAPAVLRFDLDGGVPRFATHVPGVPAVIAVGGDGTTYLAGSADGPVPTTPGALQAELKGPSDAYVVRLSADGSEPVFATYYGGGDRDGATSAAVADDGDVWIHRFSGRVASPFGDAAAFLTRISADGSRVEHELPSLDAGGALFRDAAGNLFIRSKALSPSLPTTPDALLPGGCGNRPGEHSHLRRFTPDGILEFASYLPSATAHPPILNADGVFHQISIEGLEQGGLERLLLEVSPPFAIGCVTHAASRLNHSRVSPGTIVTLVGTRMGPETGVSGAPVADRFPTELGGVRVLIGGIAAPLLYVQGNQINAVTPYGVEPGDAADVVVEYLGDSSPSLPVEVVRGDFALFSLDGSGLGQAAAFNQDGTLNAPDNPAERGSIVVLYGTGAGATMPPSEDGGLAPLANFPSFELPVEVLFNRSFTDLFYKGPAPGLVNGVVQINMWLPEDLQEGASQVLVNVVLDGNLFQSPAWISVR